MENIKKILEQKDTVLFIGSGISLWSGLPTWWKMIEELTVFVEKTGQSSELIKAEAQRGDLLQAASYGFDKLSDHQIGEFIRSSCRYGIAKPHEIHKKIVTLGPTCFVTTNYDNLIEESTREWLKDKFFRPPITNRHLTETAEIVHARSNNFVFKPHGDAGDSNSIILTREQYRKLLPGGERHAALETVKMLLASRPVVYLGFGLRDPDFLYLRDLLANTFKGGTRDHYAVMPDVDSDEVNYWRKNYGIHLINYDTKANENGGQDHGELLTLLDELKSTPALTPTINKDENNNEFSSKNVLSLARHAGRLARFEKITPEFSIRVQRCTNEKSTSVSNQLDTFDYRFVEYILSKNGPNKAIITGLPGAGKSYSMRRAAALLSEKLNDVCLAEEFIEKDVLIPIYVDLKLYEGNIVNLVNNSLPANLNIEKLSNTFEVKIFLDSFNEMPREYWDNASYEKDIIEFIESLKSTSVIIASRTVDGLSKFGIPNYNLESIELEYVESILKSKNINIGGRFKNEVIQVLQKPFFFHLFVSDKVTLPSSPHPHDIFKSFFINITELCNHSFNIIFGLELALAKIGYDALNNGNEAQPLSVVLHTIKLQLVAQNITKVDESDIVNWLISKDVFIPLIHNRISLFHQSITEYLAATELARRYQKSPEILDEKLVNTRWDQALFLTLSLLPKDSQKDFYKSIVNIDFELALSASKYIEFDRDKVVSQLLKEIPKRIGKYGHHNNNLEFIFERDIIVSDIHKPLLMDIINCKNSIGGVAAKHLATIKSDSIKDELCKLLIDNKDDYNFCANGIAPTLFPLIKDNDLDLIIDMINEVDIHIKTEKDLESCHGFKTAISTLLEVFDLEVVRKELIENKVNEISILKGKVLCELLMGIYTVEALELAVELLICGVTDAVVTIYFIAEFGSEYDGEKVKYDWSIFTDRHINSLIEHSKEKENECRWGLGVLRHICSNNSSVKESVRKRTEKEQGLFKSILTYLYSNDSIGIFECLDKMLTLSPEQLSKQPLYLFEGCDLKWENNESLFISCLKLGNSELSLALLNDTREYDFGKLEIGPIDFWLKTIQEYSSYEPEKWLAHLLSEFLYSNLSKESFKPFLAEFNRTDSQYRDILACYVLPSIEYITTDDFTDETKSYLLTKLNQGNFEINYHGGLLGNTSTEKFVSEFLLPLSNINEEPLSTNLRSVLKTAGSRHSKRYLFD
jgi:hypothetical protein